LAVATDDAAIYGGKPRAVCGIKRVGAEIRTASRDHYEEPKSKTGTWSTGKL